MKGPIIHLTLGKANPDRANGINVIVHGMAEALQRLGLPVEVWGITPTPKDETFERSYALRLFGRSSKRWSLTPELKTALVGLPDSAVVHLHGGLLPEFVQVARLLRRRKLPWVLMPHGSYSKAALRRGWLRKRLFIALFDRIVIRGAARIQLGASNSANGLARMIRPPQALVIPNGYDTTRGPHALLDAAPFRFSYCGRLASYHKGLDLLARGFVKASKGEPEMQLDLIGEGPDRAQIEGILSAGGVSERVSLHGSLFAEEKRKVLTQSNCFVLTSRHEGFPMALLEAAALGLPLLVSEGTNFANYVRKFDCGMVLPSLNAQAIAKALAAMASSSPERLREMGTNSIRLILKELHWDRIAERMQRELYAPIVGEDS